MIGREGASERSAEAYTEAMDLFTSGIREGVNQADAATEVGIKEGFSLALHIVHRDEITSNTVMIVTDPEQQRSFQICLDDHINPATIESLRLNADDLFITRDSALTDELAANVALQCRLKTV